MIEVISGLLQSPFVLFLIGVAVGALIMLFVYES